MLKEIDGVQKQNEPYRRWFEDDYFDLIVWYESEPLIKGNEIIGFQLCYDRLSNKEKALTLSRPQKTGHKKLDLEVVLKYN